VFSVWWLYFFRGSGAALARMHDQYIHSTYLWGYGHYVIFGSGAAIGAGLAARVDVWRHDSVSSHLQTAAAVIGTGLVAMSSGAPRRPIFTTTICTTSKREDHPCVP
jgi:low temperature requirement protein LtrA